MFTQRNWIEFWASNLNVGEFFCALSKLLFVLCRRQLIQYRRWAYGRNQVHSFGRFGLVVCLFDFTVNRLLSSQLSSAIRHPHHTMRSASLVEGEEIKMIKPSYKTVLTKAYWRYCLSRPEIKVTQIKVSYMRNGQRCEIMWAMRWWKKFRKITSN